jgi:protein TonB
LLKLSPVPATPYVEQLSIGAGRRALAISLALLITALLLLMLLGFGPEKPPHFKDERISVVSIDAERPAEKAAEPARREPERAKTRPLPQPPAPETPPQVTQPQAAPPPLPQLPQLPPLPPAAPAIGARPPGGKVYGPPDTGGSPSSRDSERVGTAPNGEPLYAAAWYREPSDDELRGYLSTASGPGWGLIACRTVSDYRVEDCVGLDEYPNGSQIMRAVLAAAWQFRVRPPRLGGRPMVGAWVRIRIDYGVKQR